MRLITGKDMTEEVSGVRFATLENEVKHITDDVADIKESTKTTELAIQSIDKSIAIMTEHVQQNKQLGPRIEKLEVKISKMELKLAAYTGGAAALVFVLTKWDKVIAFFGS
ncbi:hypothetical protein MAELSTROM_8 [Pseudoalteromonas phage Maelstrom]|uniref:hypothetical protein n=1 Tax=Pseudoalteromonas phage Maelstrom TaxID=2065202 RepID=UPI000CA09424|nr:hypothetical protein PP584_gp08 [Pseudoalteromonas phage Maelstrom]AUG84928.1 hypothetical protein MAELSTROM_8 [Pseudoalteromonas phage Maelstrom]